MILQQEASELHSLSTKLHSEPLKLRSIFQDTLVRISSRFNKFSTLSYDSIQYSPNFSVS